MVKSLISILIFILLSILCLPLIGLDGAVFSSNGKSSGEFIEKEDLPIEKLFKIDGISISLSSCDYSKALNYFDAKKVHYFTDGEIENYYFFSKKLPKCEVINGKKVNLHVAVSKDKVTMGSPIIYYGY